MMAWTQTEIDALKAAIGRGAKTLRLNGEEVTYGSISEMLRVLGIMEAEVAGRVAGGMTIAYPLTTRGL